MDLVPTQRPSFVYLAASKDSARVRLVSTVYTIIN